MEQRVFMRSKVALHKENLTIEIEVFFFLFANKKGEETNENDIFFWLRFRNLHTLS